MKQSLTELREEMRAVARGERNPAPLPARDVLKVLSSPEHAQLLQMIHQQRPASVSLLAAMTGRAQPNVSRSLQQLAKHGLIKLERIGREVRPVPGAATLTISLADDTYEAKP